MRIGQGYDVHRLVEGRALILGGVNIPWEKGLLGHSDADVLTHALMDALLGAAAAEPDPAAPFWPAEPKGLEPLARELGFPDVPALQKACEARL